MLRSSTVTAFALLVARSLLTQRRGHRSRNLRSPAAALIPVISSLLATPLAGTSVTIQPITPEGLILASIDLPSPSPIAIFDNSTLLTYATIGNFNLPIDVSPGHHVFAIRFNGQLVSREVDLVEGEARVLVIMFPRVVFPLVEWIDKQQIDFDTSRSYDGLAPGPGSGWYEHFDPLWYFILSGGALSTHLGPVTLHINQRLSYELTGREFLFSRSHEIRIDDQADFAASSSITFDTHFAITKPLSISIPAGPFDEWYLQYRKTIGRPDYPELSFTESASPPPTDLGRLVLGGTQGGWDYWGLLPARNPYAAARFRIQGEPNITHSTLVVCPWCENDALCCPSNASHSDVISGAIDYLSMASVPFDVLGRAVPAERFDTILKCETQSGVEADVRVEVAISLQEDPLGCQEASANIWYAWSPIAGAEFYTLNGLDVGNVTRFGAATISGKGIEARVPGCPNRPPLYEAIDDIVHDNLSIVAHLRAEI